MNGNSRSLEKTVLYLFLAAISIFCLLPFYWLLRSSLMGLVQIFEMPPMWFPAPVKFTNYSEALTILPFGRYFLNTVFIVVFTITGTILSSSVSAYSFARLKWPHRDLVFGILLSSMMLPYAVTLIPTYLGWSFLGAIDTYYPLIIPAWFGGGAFNIFLLRQFYLTIPGELDEAALIDGAGFFTIYSKIIMPLTRPALIVVGLFTFLNCWNDFLGPLVYLNSEIKYTLAIGLESFKGLYNAQWHLLMAASTVVVFPAIIIFFIGQKYFIEGIAMTGLKG
ncbi:MAG: carbohydrate ABC transporter permease [Spirochaetales bacterium]|jgi:multiple sugar transport system permease protein|nr:carbohydrate ABC transporter permease [Spirochaetales bacterium]